MTAHTHDPAAHNDSRRPQPAGAAGTNRTAARPRWLLPGVAVGVVALGLVVLGILPLAVVVYTGLFGGMMLMHMGGHGCHGGHAGHPDDSTGDAENLSARSSRPQANGTDSTSGLDDRAATDPHGKEPDDHDQNSTHGCH